MSAKRKRVRPLQANACASILFKLVYAAATFLIISTRVEKSLSRFSAEDSTEDSAEDNAQALKYIYHTSAVDNGQTFLKDSLLILRRMKFDYTLNYDEIDFRAHPELYRVGRGEQGVLSVEPYKSEILPHWRFKTPEIARLSALKIYELFLEYKRANDFVGMDMARKFLQMGWTRSLRYFNHRSGRKYVGPVPLERRGQSGAWGRDLAPFERDYEKLECSKIFKQQLDIVKADAVYNELKREHQSRYEDGEK